MSVFNCDVETIMNFNVKIEAENVDKAAKIAEKSIIGTIEKVKENWLGFMMKKKPMTTRVTRIRNYSNDIEKEIQRLCYKAQHLKNKINVPLENTLEQLEKLTIVNLGIALQGIMYYNGVEVDSLEVSGLIRRAPEKRIKDSILRQTELIIELSRLTKDIVIRWNTTLESLIIIFPGSYVKVIEKIAKKCA